MTSICFGQQKISEFGLNGTIKKLTVKTYSRSEKQSKINFSEPTSIMTYYFNKDGGILKSVKNINGQDFMVTEYNYYNNLLTSFNLKIKGILYSTTTVEQTSPFSEKQVTTFINEKSVKSMTATANYRNKLPIQATVKITKVNSNETNISLENIYSDQNLLIKSITNEDNNKSDIKTFEYFDFDNSGNYQKIKEYEEVKRKDSSERNKMHISTKIVSFEYF